jgi:hypothetical protein
MIVLGVFVLIVCAGMARLHTGKFAGVVLGLVLAYNVFHESNADFTGSPENLIQAAGIQQPQPSPAQLQQPQADDAPPKAPALVEEDAPPGSCVCWRKEQTKISGPDKATRDRPSSVSLIGSSSLTSSLVNDVNNSNLVRGLAINLQGIEYTEAVSCCSFLS